MFSHDIVIVGGGAAGISFAASLIRRRAGLDIVIVEPRDTHYYQPGFTLVGAGIFTTEQLRRPTASIIPKGATWLRTSVESFDPQSDSVILKNGSRLHYRLLVVATGNRLDFDSIEGLSDTLGKNGVTSNYRSDLAPYTWELVRNFAKGRALFTQPPMPIKCAGAPQKAMYLSCSEWERHGLLEAINVEFHSAGAVLFGVPAYVAALEKTVERYGIDVHLGSNLIAVNGSSKSAVFKTATGEIEREFDMLHVTPPQKSCKVVADSELADAAGYVEVDQVTLRHKRFLSVMALGDAGSMPNAKTAAAIRKQAPVAAVNALAILDGNLPSAAYDGYGSCPLTVEKGKIILAEFGYGGVLQPSLPTWLIDGTKPSRLAWMLKKDLLPPIYWDAMLKGHEWLAAPQPIQDAAQ